eukprot:gene4494-81_t
MDKICPLAAVMISPHESRKRRSNSLTLSLSLQRNPDTNTLRPSAESPLHGTVGTDTSAAATATATAADTAILVLLHLLLLPTTTNLNLCCCLNPCRELDENLRCHRESQAAGGSPAVTTHTVTQSATEQCAIQGTG